MAGRVECATCHKKKELLRFRLLQKNPNRYSKDCLVCLKTKNIPDTPGQRRMAAIEIEAELSLNRELHARELARRRLVHFINRFESNYLAGWVHRDVCARLERFLKAVEEKREPRLMLFLPPRIGKSMMASNYFPSWALGHHPEWEIIATSYAVSLPMDFSRKIRARARDPAYRAMFPSMILDPESQSVERWMTTAGGGYVAAGVRGPITGKGANILIVDDPIKDDEEADSEVIRESIWDWMSSTASTRVSPGGGILIIQTRWHDADLAGKFLDLEAAQIKEDVPSEMRQNWEVASYPAINDMGDEYLTDDHRIVYEKEPGAKLVRKKNSALHEERFPLQTLLKKKAMMIPRHWSALYQQNPVPESGEYFTADMIRYYTQPFDFSTGYVHYLAGDLAISKNQKADNTVLVVGAYDQHGDVYLRDMIRGRLNTFEIIDALMTLWTRYNCELCGIERGQIELAIKPVLLQAQARKNIVMTFDDELKPITDKITRARPLQGWMQQGKVRFPKGQPWVDTMVSEMLRFPDGVRDDCVDAPAWLVRMLARRPLPTPKYKKKREKSWRDRVRQLTAGPTKHWMGA